MSRDSPLRYPHMLLTILYNDGSLDTLVVKRVSNISTTNPIPYLYYECGGHERGRGKCVPMANIKCWEIEFKY